MIRFFFIFTLLLVSVGLGVLLKQDPGYLLIAIHHWTIETTLWIGLTGLVLIFCTLHLLLLLLHKIVSLPKKWSHWRLEHRRQNAQAKTRQGLIEFSEGHWLQAKNHLIKALPDTDTPLLNYLTAARAAQEIGDNKLRDDYLREAQQSMPEAKIAVELTQAQLQLANRQWEQALATLRHLQDLAPRHPYVLKLLMHLYEEIKDWPQLIALLPELKRADVVSGEAYQEIQQNAYLQALNDLIRQDQGQILESFIEKLPKNLVNDVGLVSAYSQYLLNKHNAPKAEALLRRCLRKNFSARLITLYGLTNGHDNQLNFAESLLQQHPHSAALFLCLGRLSTAKHLWGKAKTYFEQSLDASASPEACMALGTLLLELNDAAGACDIFQKGLELSLQK